jgi:hypothetical protein
MRRLILLSIFAFPAYAVDNTAANNNSSPKFEAVQAQPPLPRQQSATSKKLDDDDFPVSGSDIDDPEQPDLPASIKSGQPIDAEPEINIIKKGKKTIQEYRKNGVLYMVKVIPDIGPPYYFLDTNGDGVLDTRRSTQSQDTNVNMWKLIEW